MLFSLMFASLNETERKFFDELYEKYGKMMYGMAINILHDPNDTEDAIQETMYKIMKHVDQFEGDDRIRTLTKVEIGLRTSIYHTACTQYRKKKKQLANEIQTYFMTDEEEAPVDIEVEDELDLEELIIIQEECQKVKKALLELSSPLQDAINLVYFCGMSQVAAADFLGIKDDALRNRIFHARKKLKVALEVKDNEFVAK